MQRGACGAQQGAGPSRVQGLAWCGAEQGAGAGAGAGAGPGLTPPIPAVAAVYDVTLNFRGNKNPSLLGILYGKKYEADMCVR